MTLWPHEEEWVPMDTRVGFWPMLVGFAVLGGLLLFLLGPLIFAPSRETIREVLGDHGYSDIQIRGPQITGCAYGDEYRVGFTGKTMSGNKVTGVVCGGAWQAFSIRTYK